MRTVELILVSPKRYMCIAWEKYFHGLPRVTIAEAAFENLPSYDCIVSSANSFGLMDGGVDKAIINFFGSGLMDRVQEKILKEFLGEQPVGTSIILETGNKRYPYVAHSPTMRSPMPIRRTDNVYLSLWATLLAVYKHNRVHGNIRIIACPALGTGAGDVPFAEAARQMSLAYKHFLDPPVEIDWNLAIERQGRIMLGGDLSFNLHED